MIEKTIEMDKIKNPPEDLPVKTGSYYTERDSKVGNLAKVALEFELVEDTRRSNPYVNIGAMEAEFKVKMPPKLKTDF